MRVLASSLRNPLGIIETADGELLTVEFDTGRLVRVGDGHVVAGGFRKRYALTRSPGGTIYVVESGGLGRASGGIARVATNGTVTRLRLVPV